MPAKVLVTSYSFGVKLQNSILDYDILVGYSSEQ